ncbi:flagellar biosynthesis protein FlhB [Rubellimicrobium sp. CFH 75288]|uniref:EscU/YscU/HrcU family type III secretion system export apparatus switch protein n=1 Tax=Rubellimicrobium sp. CFH 75288 TaxID=2697034 RepID=UPI001412F501|nr:flagellar type III secretion system protein FlhB [Rubellimicrobium sp. CFH 75288]NAZ37286.1 flagellar type III secretion system protein FlhB [Rubellimicrobium sp. CFH 75288]
MSGGREEDGAERSFEPTPRRLEEARRRGEAAHSQDLVTAAAFAGFLVAALAFGPGALARLGTALAAHLAAIGPAGAWAAEPARLPAATLLVRTVAALWPFLLLPAGAALLAAGAQGALRPAPGRLAPKASRLSPLAQLRHRFGPEGLGEFLRGLVKVAAYGAILGAMLAATGPDLAALAGRSPGGAFGATLHLAVDLVWRIALVAALIGGADLLWQKYRFRRRQMMTRREIAEETRENEGDPHMRQQRRSRGQSIATNRMLAEVPRASVVIVNPTHYAVALAWDPARGGAPVCIAKGVDEMAARIRERAAGAGVPIRRDPPTARAIHATVALGEEVRRTEWQAVAAALRFAERVRQGVPRR